MLVVMSVGSTIQTPDFQFQGYSSYSTCAANPLYSRPVSGRDSFSEE